MKLSTLPLAALLLIPSLVSAEAPKKASPTVKAEQSTAQAVAATVNGTTITVAKVDEEIKRQPLLGYEMSQAKNDPAKVLEVKRKAVNAIIERKLLLEAASAQGGKSDDISKAVDAFIKTNYQSEENLGKLLQSIGTTLPQFKEELAGDFKIRAFLEQTFAAAPQPTDADLKKIYDAAPDKYATKESVRARHILLMSKPDASADEDKAIATKIADLHKKVTAPGADFAAVAKESSQCPSAPTGGDLGFFQKGMMVPEFEKAAFALKPGSISEPIKTQFGYHIIKTEEYKAAAPASFESAKDALTKQFANEKKVALIKAKLDELRSKAQIKVML
jgi:peptidyl-prolyl cis-trans isomerase C